MTKHIFVLFIAVLLFSCLSTAQDKDKKEDFDLMMQQAFEHTNSGKYQKSIDLLNEIIGKFPDKEILSVNYNIGYNYFKLNKPTESKTYLTRVVSLFQNTRNANFDPDDARKFDILAKILIEKIDNSKKDKTDPYHVKEELNEKNKLKPKKKN